MGISLKWYILLSRSNRYKKRTLVFSVVIITVVVGLSFSSGYLFQDLNHTTSNLTLPATQLSEFLGNVVYTSNANLS
ncbi:MAG: hypothetical protein ACP5UO_06520, partial [Thermoplasmata archaeon]